MEACKHNFFLTSHHDQLEFRKKNRATDTDSQSGCPLVKDITKELLGLKEKISIKRWMVQDLLSLNQPDPEKEMRLLLRSHEKRFSREACFSSKIFREYRKNVD